MRVESLFHGERLRTRSGAAVVEKLKVRPGVRRVYNLEVERDHCYHVSGAEVPGKVPGSKAVYQKTVDVNGVTTSFTKTTFDPQGNIVHIKNKLP